jgi:hypothetical protein
MSQQSPQPIKPGVRFRDGKLYEFSEKGIMVLRQWPDLRAWRKTPKGRTWRPIRPALHLESLAHGWTCRIEPREPRIRSTRAGTPIRWLFDRDPAGPDEEPLDRWLLAEFFGGALAGLEDEPEDEPGDEPDAERDPGVQGFQGVQGAPELDSAARDARRRWSEQRRMDYLQPIPGEVLAAVGPFACRHWHLLNLIARCPGALELARANPALAFALASPWVFRRPAPKQPLRAARALLRRPQHEIAGWLGFPRTRSTVRILRKLPPAKCTVPNLLNLRRLCESHPKPLRHLDRLGEETIRLLQMSGENYKPTGRYLAEVSAHPPPVWLHGEPQLVQDVLWLRDSVGEVGPMILLSHSHLVRTHDRLVERLGRMDLKKSARPLPEPPLSGIQSDHLRLEPLRTEEELVEEGRVQRNCVGAYGPRVRQGGLYIYRVTAPERATLSIVRVHMGKWRISELKAAENRPVSDVTADAIHNWLRGGNCHQLSLFPDLPF